MRGECRGVKARVFRGDGCMGCGQRTARKEEKGGRRAVCRGKDDAKVENGGREGLRGGGRRTRSGSARRGEGREMKKFYLHFQPFMQRLTPFASLRLFLSLLPRARVSNLLVLPPSSFLLLLLPLPLLLPPPRFVPSTTAGSPPSASATSHPLTSAIPQRSPSSLRAMSPRSARSRGQPPR